MFGLSSVYIFGPSSANKFGPSSVNRLYEFEFFIFRLHLESDVSVGGIVFHKLHFYYYYYFKICMILLFGLFVKVN